MLFPINRNKEKPKEPYSSPTFFDDPHEMFQSNQPLETHLVAPHLIVEKTLLLQKNN